MSDNERAKKIKIKKLEANKETIIDLTEGEIENVKGGGATQNCGMDGIRRSHEGTPGCILNLDNDIRSGGCQQ